MPILFATILIDLIGFGIVIPILPFLAPQLGADKLDIAFLIVVYAIFAGLCGPYWGRLSDRLGRKPVIMICLAGAALSYVLLGLASELRMIFCARAFAGTMAGNYGVVSAMIADLTTPANRARGMGMLGAGFGLGMVIGPVMGGLLAGPENSFSLPCLVAGGMSVTAIIAAQLFLRESLSAEKRRQNREHHRSGPRQSVFTMLRETGNTLMVLQFVLHTTCISSVTYLFPLWVGDELSWGAREVGMVFGVQGLIGRRKESGGHREGGRRHHGGQPGRPGRFFVVVVGMSIEDRVCELVHFSPFDRNARWVDMAHLDPLLVGLGGNSARSAMLNTLQGDDT